MRSNTLSGILSLCILLCFVNVGQSSYYDPLHLVTVKCDQIFVLHLNICKLKIFLGQIWFVCKK